VRLRGRKALITGATGGLGSAIARRFAAEGAKVALHGLTVADTVPLQEQIQAGGGEAAVVTGDVRAPDQVDALVASAEDQLGGIDILVNNAGVISDAPFLELSVGAWQNVLATNLTGYFLVGQRVAQGMASRGYGRIVNISSTRQTQPWTGSAAYCASKGGIAMLTKVMALELAPLGIRVNSIAPGTVLTGLNRHYLGDAEFQASRVATIPAGRLGVPGDVASAAVLLASDDADFMVGTSIMIDGGQTLT
jgi:NAD(P)-dependent dehydrogenase (short-subunit alcohol dehydrogenase family)